ncbi:MAG TPA: methyltransferase [Kofleriaceae bacterium]|nr:methyltransferase [Kofleriaceae bacterium]
MRDQLTGGGEPGAGAPLEGLRGGVPPITPRDEVVALYTDMAPRFDALLVDELEYRIPEKLVVALDLVAPDRRFAHALDLGCGTGLTGALLRARCDVLEGVDVTPAMLDRARARGVYDRLHQADLVEHLQETAARPDLVVATDVLIYVGDLEPVFAGARAVLAGGGLFAASVERHDGVDVERGPTGRYRHSRGYLERLAADHDLAVLGFDPRAIRLEGGAFVPGWLFVLAAGAPPAARRGRAQRSRSDTPRPSGR